MLGTHPRKTEKKDRGECGAVVEFGGVRFRPRDFVMSDRDGVVVVNRVQWDKIQQQEE